MNTRILFIMALPIIFAANFYITWIAAWVVLGHIPKPSINDPKELGIIVSIPYIFTKITLIIFPAIITLGLFLIYGIKQELVEKIKYKFIPYMMLWTASIIFLKWDPLDVVNWFMD